MEQTLAMDKQIILFQNQRGYAPVMGVWIVVICPRSSV